MKSLSKSVALVVAFCVLSTPVFACYSTYFNDVFTKLNKAGVNKEQLTALRTLKQQMITNDHNKGKCDRAHDLHEAEFVAAAAGILSDGQFKTVTGKAKTEVQKLRYEVNQLKKEIAEIKAMLRAMK